jgi:hypothetical protein
MRFLFIHEGKSDDTIKNFLQDSYEFYVKVINFFIILFIFKILLNRHC